MKVIFRKSDGRLLGAQMLGEDGVPSRINAFAMAIQTGLTVYDLEEFELAEPCDLPEHRLGGRTRARCPGQRESQSSRAIEFEYIHRESGYPSGPDGEAEGRMPRAAAAVIASRRLCTPSFW